MRIGDTNDGGIAAVTASRGPAPALVKKAETKDEREEPSPFARVLHGLGREVDRGEAFFAKAMHAGKAQLGTGDLLALQAGVYRYSEAVDLSAKLVDRATNGVKTVLQGQ